MTCTGASRRKSGRRPLFRYAATRPWPGVRIAKGTDRAESDIDVLVVADSLTLEELYRALHPAETRLGRKSSPTLYTSKEFERRRAAKNPFLAKVLAGDRILLIGTEDAAVAAR